MIILQGVVTKTDKSITEFRRERVESTAYLNNNVYPELSPRKLKRVSVGNNLYGLAINTDGLVVHNFHLCLESSKHGIIFQ
jgi:hypothetical protein